jgi:hypothetical protein
LELVVRDERVVQIAEFAGESIAITEIAPYFGQFVGKQIAPSGHISEYPDVTWWRQRVELVPATTNHLFAYLRTARLRNICLIRGAPANLERKRTLRQIAYETKRGKDRGDHGFVDEPTRWFSFDVDGAPIRWQKNPEKAIRTLLDILGEPWASTSFVWFFSSTHGLEIDKQERDEQERNKKKKQKKKKKRWTGKIIDGKLRVRIFFITDRGRSQSPGQYCQGQGPADRHADLRNSATKLHQAAVVDRGPRSTRRYRDHRPMRAGA